MSGSRPTERTMRVNTRPDRRTLHRFGFVWLGFLSVFGALAFLRAESLGAAAGLWAAAVLVPVVGWTFPPVMRFVYVGLSYLAWPVGWVVSHAVLAVVFYLLVTPIGLCLRLLGRDPLERSIDRGASTYWEGRDGETPVSRYFRQF